VSDPADAETTRQALAWLAVGEMQTDASGRRVTVPVARGAVALTEALGRLAAEGVAVRDAGLRRPTLDDVFLTLTGHGAHAINGNHQTKEFSR
jgi:ABC-2 type transport system ATP-binding protein